MKRLLFILSLIPSLCFGQGDQTTINVPINGAGTTIKAALHLPDDYEDSTSKYYPMIVFHHGDGEGGSDINKLYTTQNASLPYIIAHGQFPISFVNPKDGRTYKFIVVTPQNPNVGQGALSPTDNDYILYYLKTHYRVDTNRIYGGGYSNGGYTTWNYAAHYTVTPRTLYAAFAIMSMATTGDATDAGHIAADSIRDWGMGALSDIWGVKTKAGVDLLNGISPDLAHWTEYTCGVNGGHGCWYEHYLPTYKEYLNVAGTTRYDSMNVYQWMLQFRRGISPYDDTDVTYTPPTANAGSDQSLANGTFSTTLDGSNSTGGTGSIVSYHWEKISGYPARINSPNSATTTIAGLLSGKSYTFRLTVTDAADSTDTDDITISVSGTNPDLGDQYITDVGCAEYSVAYRTNTGRVYTPVYNSPNHVQTDLGLAHIKEITGGQYTNAALDSSGNVFVWGVRLDTFMNTVTTDADGNAFTDISHIYGWAQTDNGNGGDFPCMVAIKDGDIYVWGKDMLRINGDVDVPAPTKLNTPSGKTFVKLAFYAASHNVILAMTADSLCYRYDSNDGDPTTPTQISFNQPVRDIASISGSAMVVETDTALYAWGGHGEYLGAGTGSTSPQSITKYWKAKGVVFPTKELVGNSNTLHLIDQNDNMFGEGDNIQGEIGNGDQFNPWRLFVAASSSRAPFAWDFSYGGKLVGVTQIPGKFKNLQSGPTFTYYYYVQDMGDNWYSWGRNKGITLGNGLTVNLADANLYADWQNIPAPARVDPLHTAIQFYPAGATQGGAALFDTTAVQLPIANAGVNQWITTDTTTLHGELSSQQDETVTAYSWSKVEGGSATINSPESATTAITGLSNGTYKFRLQVTNGLDSTDADTVTVNVSGVVPPSQDGNTTTPGLLDVKFQSFNYVEPYLKWATANEINSDYFSVIKSVDGINWQEIGRISTKAENGYSATELNYQYKIK